MSKERRVIFKIGFDETKNFFRLHVPEGNRNRLALAEGAIDLLKRAWPHLVIEREVVDLIEGSDQHGN